jgi:ABC-2 type transport system ATP-binding protein
LIEIQNLQKIIGQETALDIPKLTIENGEVAAIIGPPGCGKELFFDLLIGKTVPSAGLLRLAGIDPRSKAHFGLKVGVLFHEDGLYHRMSPAGNLLFSSRIYALPKTRSEQILTQIGLADQANTTLDKLAPGLQRRLAFGRAILHQPEVLMLFEPFARCDSGTIQVLSGLVRRQAGEGCTVLILADDATHLEELATVIYRMECGRLKEMETTSPAHEPAPSFKIPVRSEDKVILLNPLEILYAEAEGSRVFLYTTGGRLPSQFTLTELEERLGRSGFFRAHRAYLVNLQHIKEVITYTRNSFNLRLDDPEGSKIPLSKAAAGELRNMLGY